MARRNQKEREPRLSKAQTGIDGVDEITGGGLPRGRTTLLAGPAGSGGGGVRGWRSSTAGCLRGQCRPARSI